MRNRGSRKMFCFNIWAVTVLSRNRDTVIQLSRRTRKDASSCSSSMIALGTPLAVFTLYRPTPSVCLKTKIWTWGSEVFVNFVEAIVVFRHWPRSRGFNQAGWANLWWSVTMLEAMARC